MARALLKPTSMTALKLLPLLSLAVPALAHAEPEPAEASTGFDHAVAPVSGALELAIGTGYSQAAGDLGGSRGKIQDMSGPGGAVELDLGYRIIPELTVGAYGTFSKFQRGDALASDTDVFGATAGLQAAWHFRPDRSVDPWISLGTGWKALWQNPTSGKVTSLQGFELARLQVGVDYRLSKDISIAPVIGASLSMFVAEDGPDTMDYTEITDKKLNVTGFAGLSGRFDLGGGR